MTECGYTEERLRKLEARDDAIAAELGKMTTAIHTLHVEILDRITKTYEQVLGGIVQRSERACDRAEEAHGRIDRIEGLVEKLADAQTTILYKLGGITAILATLGYGAFKVLQ